MSDLCPSHMQARIVLRQFIAYTSTLYPPFPLKHPWASGAHLPVAPDIQCRQAWTCGQIEGVSQVGGTRSRLRKRPSSRGSRMCIERLLFVCGPRSTRGQLEIASGSREAIAVLHTGMEANRSLSLPLQTDSF